MTFITGILNNQNIAHASNTSTVNSSNIYSMTAQAVAVRRLDILNKAQGRWGEILTGYGLTLPLHNKCGSCPLCGAEGFYFCNAGSGWFNCNQCGKGNGLNLLITIAPWSESETFSLLGEWLALNRNEARVYRERWGGRDG